MQRRFEEEQPKAGLGGYMYVLFKITAGTYTWRCSLGLQHKSRFRMRKSKLHLDSRHILLRPGHSKLHLHIIKRSGNLCKELLLRKPVLNFTAMTVYTKPPVAPPS